MKFKIGERVRIRRDLNVKSRYALGKEARIVGLPGAETKDPDRYVVEIFGAPPPPDYGWRPDGYWRVLESAMQKLLPDSDTYHPANISIDDLMRTIKTPETVT